MPLPSLVHVRDVDRPLTKDEFDGNYDNLDGRITLLEDNPPVAVSVDDVTQTGDQFTFVMTDATTHGPFTIPKVTYVDRGTWAPSTAYAIYDTFTINGALYEVIFAHTSALTFDPSASDGMGHSYYHLIFSAPSNALPTSGETGSVLKKRTTSDYDTIWDFVNASETIYDPSSDSGLTSNNVADALEELEGLIPNDAFSVHFEAGTPSDLTSLNVGDAILELETMIGTGGGGGGDLLSTNNLSDLTSAATARTNLGLAIGSDVQAYDAELAALAGLTSVADSLPYFTGSGTAALATLTTFIRTLLDDTSQAAAQGTLGVVPGTDVQAYDAQLSSLVRQNSKSAAYTTILTDGGKHIYHPSGDNNARTFTIDSNANVAYPIGTTLTFVNEINTVTIAITADTLVLAGTGSTGSRTLAANGIATALKVGTTRWYISGTGLT